MSQDKTLTEREAFKAHHKGLLDLTEKPGPWGDPVFVHSHVEAGWMGWRDRAAHLECTGQSVTNDAVHWQSRMRHCDNGVWDDWSTTSQRFAEAVWRGEHSDGSWEFEARALSVTTTPPEAATAEAAGKAPASVPNEGIQSLISAIESHAQQELVPPFSRLKAWADQLRRIAALTAQPRSTPPPAEWGEGATGLGRHQRGG